jgi:hypothetical protein
MELYGRSGVNTAIHSAVWDCACFSLYIAMRNWYKASMRPVTTFVLRAVAVLIVAVTARALPLSYLIELERAKIEPAAKSFQQECGGRADNQNCREQRDAVVKALNGFVNLVQKELALLSPTPAADADFQKQTEARRTRMQQDLQWAQEQLKALPQ